jgi:hypothetical protein
VRIAPRPETIRESEEVVFVDCVQHLDRRTLDNLVFQCGHAERSLPPVGLGYVHSPDRLRSIRSALQPTGKTSQINIQVLSVVLPRLAVHSRCGMPLEAQVSLSEAIDVINVVPERREL